MNVPILRFKGAAFEMDGGWGWECLISMLGDNENGSVYHSKHAYKTKAIAIEDLKKFIQFAIKIMEEECGLHVNSGNYIDMKTNTTRRWDKKDEQ